VAGGVASAIGSGQMLVGRTSSHPHTVSGEVGRWLGVWLLPLPVSTHCMVLLRTSSHTRTVSGEVGWWLGVWLVPLPVVWYTYTQPFPLLIL